MSQSNYITLALSVFIGLIFLIDYLKKRKEDSFDKSVEKFVQKKRKPSKVKILTIVLSLILIVCSIVFKDYIEIHFLEPESHTIIFDEDILEKRSHVDGESYYNKLEVNQINTIKKGSAFDINGNFMGILVDGQRQGEWRDFNQKNHLIIHGFYKNGLMNGDFKHYDEFGILHHKGSYINGSGERNQNSGIPESGRNGMHYWYYTNGRVSSSGNYSYGKIDGIFKTYWKNGVLKNKSRVNNGYLIESSIVRWDRNGKLIE